jgi:RimJ/RimL family protein N-acetyltransferase
MIGNLYFHRLDYGTWELGYVFNAAYQGKGYAFESACALMDYAFQRLDVRRISGMCNPSNERSWHLMEKLHMRREGNLKQNIYFKRDRNDDPVWQDTYEYAILKDEWQSR